MTEAERSVALEQIAAEVRGCTRCRLHEGRTRAVPGEGNPETEVMFVGEGPGQNEDREGRPFVGRAGALLVKLLASIGWRRDEVFITNVVKCRPPGNRDPLPDEIAACAPYLRRQLEVLDPALVVTLGRYSMGAFMPGSRISQVHGTTRPIDPATGARDAMAFAMYHPAAALRASEIERTSIADMASVPAALLASRARRARHEQEAAASATIAGSATVGSRTTAQPQPAPEAERVVTLEPEQIAAREPHRGGAPVPESVPTLASESVAPVPPVPSVPPAPVEILVSLPLGATAAPSEPDGDHVREDRGALSAARSEPLPDALPDREPTPQLTLF